MAPPKSQLKDTDTDANMTVFNDTMSDTITVKVDPSHMGENFPSGPLNPATSKENKVSANTSIYQSSFKLSMSNATSTIENTCKVNIGEGTEYNTSYTPTSTLPVGSSSAVLAPGEPLSDGVDYNFYFFCGPGILTPLINGYIQTNLAAITSWIKTNPIKNIFHGVDLTITSIPNKISCSYAAVTVQNTNKDTGLADKFNVNVVMNVDGNVSGNMSSSSISTGDFGVSIKNLALYLSITIDISNSPKWTIEVTTFKVSLDGYSLSGVIAKILLAFPFFAFILQFADGYRAAGVINSNSVAGGTTNVNNEIISSINSAIANHLPKSELGSTIKNIFSNCKPPSSKGDSGHKKAACVPEKAIPKDDKEINAVNYSQWMSAYQGSQFGDLVLPGTHDSATYALTNDLGLIKYGDIDFLWDFNFTASAPPINTNPFSPLIYTGPVLGDYFINAMKAVSQAQGNNILQQLQDGIRFFDLRIYYDPTDGKCYSQHALKGPALDDIIAQVVQFLGQSTTELIVLSISHTKFEIYNSTTGPNPAVTSASLSLAQIPSTNLYVPSGAKGTQRFDLDSIATLTIGDIIAGTGSKVMILNVVDTKDPIAVFPDLAVNTSAYSSNTDTSQSPWPSGLNMVTTAQTLITPDIVGNILVGLTQSATSTTGKEIALKDHANLNNSYNASKVVPTSPLGLVMSKAGKFNVLNFDWYETYPTGAGIYGPVDLVLAINAGVLKPSGW